MQHPKDWSIDFSEPDPESNRYISLGGVTKINDEGKEAPVGVFSILRSGEDSSIPEGSGSEFTICGQKGAKTTLGAKYVYVINLDNAVFSASTELKSLGSEKPAADLPSESDVENFEKILANAKCEIPAEVTKATYPSDWLKYTAIYTSEKDITFHAPKIWGPLKTASFDDSGNYFYLQFPKMGDDVRIGAPEPNYATPGRGGALTDITDFTVKDDGVYTEGLNSGSDNKAAGYSVLPGTQSKVAVNYAVDFFGQSFMHGIVKTEGRTTAVNFVVNDGVLTQEQFKLLLASVDIE